MPTTTTTSARSPHIRTRLLRGAGLALVAAALTAAAASCAHTGDERAARSTAAPSTAATTDVPTPTNTPTTNTPTTDASTTDTSTTSTVASHRPTATRDEVVGATGARVHVRCTGSGDTTVLLIAGFGGSMDGWVVVEPALATRARVCSYDKPGSGTSDPATSTATFTAQALALHDLLAEIGEPGPYVVVGHSFGGATAVEFAARYADEVTGLALVDASPTTWPAAVCSVADDGSETATVLRSNCTTAFLPAGNGEHLDVVAGFAEVASIATLGSLPMSVITAVDRELPGLAAPEAARLTQVWNEGQQAWVALSDAAHLVSVAHSGHHIELDQPAVVIDEIDALLP